MPLKAIFLGSLGVLAETSELNRRALNAAFAEFSLDWQWDLAAYRAHAGRWCCTASIADYARQQGADVDAEAICAHKDRILRDLLGQVRVPPRPGLTRLLQATRGAGLLLGLVTTAEADDVDAMLAVTGLNRRSFDFVGDASLVAAPKPAPDIYSLALSRLALAPTDALAIEEPGESRAATTAGLSCASFPGVSHLAGRLGAVSKAGARGGNLRLGEPRLARRA